MTNQKTEAESEAASDPASGTASEAEPNAGKDQLIESIYRIALEPQTYDNFMGHWDEYISQRLGALEDLQNTQDTMDTAGRHPEIASHFDIASRLLEQMEHKAPEMSEPQQVGTSEPQMLVDGTGSIVWSNSAATKAFKLSKTSTIAEFDLPSNQLEGLRAMAASLGGPVNHMAPVVLKLVSGESDRPFYLYARVLPEQHNEDIILISKVTPDWPDDMPALLTDAFGFSASEVDICALIADGQGAAQIAEQRDSALSTVRTQIKRIMAKSSCSTQPELVRLLHSIMRVAEKSARHRTPMGIALDRRLYINLPDRVMPVEQFGDPNGAPVIFFHGMLDNNMMPPAMQVLLQENKIRLLSPVRPWFGTAAGSDVAMKDALDRFALDVLCMMEQLQLREPVLLGHMAGTVYAFATANAAPSGTFKGLVSVSGGVPITSLSQFSTMSTRQRLVAYTARFTPKMLSFVLRAGISQMESGGDQKFMHSLFESSPDDWALIADSKIRSSVLAGYHFAVEQGHKAFEIDSHQVVNDWTHQVDGNDVRIKVIHGRTDPVVNAASVEGFFAQRGNRADVTVIENCGQLVLHKHPEIVVDAVKQLIG